MILFISPYGTKGYLPTQVIDLGAKWLIVVRLLPDGSMVMRELFKG